MTVDGFRVDVARVAFPHTINAFESFLTAHFHVDVIKHSLILNGIAKQNDSKSFLIP